MNKQDLIQDVSQNTLQELYECIDSNHHFRLEAGAGAGKTHSLIKVLEYLISKHQDSYIEKGKRIACITYTNVAKDEILKRIDKHPIVFCETNHAFCWNIISPFQKKLKELIPQIREWKERLEEYSNNIDGKKIIYELGYRLVKEDYLSLHHDDIIILFTKLLEEEKFRHILSHNFPIILIDEYQDADRKWIDSIKNHLLEDETSPLFGFFGDHWQKIYKDGCGLIEHRNIKEIKKKENFRSNKAIVEVLNKMRDELPQYPKDNSLDGKVYVFHTNDWNVNRQTSAHWKGDLSQEDSSAAFLKVKSILESDGWSFASDKIKILMLTHKLLANQQGYKNIADIFKNNESFIKKENKYISFFVDKLEPAYIAFCTGKYGLMFDILEQKNPLINSFKDKTDWHNSMVALGNLRKTGKIKDVIEFLKKNSKPRLPDSILDMDHKLIALMEHSEQSTVLDESKKLYEIPYSEIIELKAFLDGYSPFQTQHGVKGAEFENVIVIIGRGWNHYNFGDMLNLVENKIPMEKEEFFERNRNLFYVSCSRAKKKLAILFTQKLEEPAINTLNKWFGKDNVKSL